MRTKFSFVLLLASLCSLIKFSLAQDVLKITQPKEKHYLKPGETYQILWQANQTTPYGDEIDIVSIELVSDQNIATIFPGHACIDTPEPTCIEVASNISNTGNFTWKIPANAPQSPNYFLDIYVPDPPFGGPYYWMTGNFSINSTTPSNSLLVVPTYSPPNPNTTLSANSTNSTLAADGSDGGSGSGSGMSTAAIGGIIGAIVGGCLLIAFIVTLITLRRKTRYQASKNLRNSVAMESTWRKDEPPSYKSPTKEEIEMTEDHRSGRGGGIRYPDPDEMDRFVAGGRLRSDQSRI